MSANTWLIISIVGFSLSAIGLVVSIVIFFRMNILAVIGDLSGKTVAREIQAIREANANSGDRRFRSSRVNIERGALTEKVSTPTLDKNAMELAHASKRLDNTSSGLRKEQHKVVNKAKNTDVLSGEVEVIEETNKHIDSTEVLTDNKTELLNIDVTAVLDPQQTEVLQTKPTEVLNSNQTKILSTNQTTVLNGTTVLSQTEELSEEQLTQPVKFSITRSITITESDDIVE